ncbi:aminoglycoside phosphotransferase family protein [Ornithinimicrobium murale]|uniref:aminoglycoside phosphotransferase family protein n=1 Tax=Ornithinimicrobium murale TaxID=1050153 RepID=UPI001EDE4E50|nr:aminoglycoside phosphotransferase family protein [Ornithinimicrobium murale]
MATTGAVVNQAVQNKARMHGATTWLQDVPELLAEVAAEWDLTTGSSYADSTEAHVLEVTTGEGVPAVLKLLVPGDRGQAEGQPGRLGGAARREITVLQLTDGHGCPRLLRHDVARSALLLERLGPSMHELRLPLAQRQDLLCDAAQRVWRPAPEADLPSGAEKGRWLVDFITHTWESLGRPCRERVVAHALECAARRIAAHDDERAVLVHGDVHEWNALRAADGFKLVDPDGLLAEAEYDLGVLMREDPADLLHGGDWERAGRLADRTGLDATATWEWGVVERVSTGLLLLAIDLPEVGADMLAVADRVSRESR